MEPNAIARPIWEIDQVLEKWIGQDVRVAAAAFSPARWDGNPAAQLVSHRDLVLPDNTRAGGLPLYVEGRLRRFVRRIAVVYADLDGPSFPQPSAEGVVYFRGKNAVILRGPATVQLAFPFKVERLPAQIDHYWADLRVRSVQFELPLVTPIKPR